MRTPRRAGLVAAVAASAAVAVGGAGAASAAPAAHTSATMPDNFCPAATAHAAVYPPAQRCVIKVTATIYVDGQKITFTAYYFTPFARGTITIHSANLQVGTFTANAQGVVDASVTVPAGLAPGQHTLTLTGDDGTVVSTPFTVVAPTSGTTPGSSGSGTLPFTGADVTGLAGGGLALIVGGGLLTVVFRRRRNTPTA